MQSLFSRHALLEEISIFFGGAYHACLPQCYGKTPGIYPVEHVLRRPGFSPLEQCPPFLGMYPPKKCNPHGSTIFIPGDMSAAYMYTHLLWFFKSAAVLFYFQLSRIVGILKSFWCMKSQFFRMIETSRKSKKGKE